MLTVLIGLLAAFLIFYFAQDGSWGGVVLIGIVTLILILMADGDRKDTKALLNFRDYWANGGPKEHKEDPLIVIENHVHNTSNIINRR